MDQPTPPELAGMVQLFHEAQATIEAARRTIVCHPDRLGIVQQYLTACGLDGYHEVVTSPHMDPNTAYVMPHHPPPWPDTPIQRETYPSEW